MLRIALLFLLFSSLVAKPIETFYGSVDVTEPVLLELIESKAFQRLKSIHQYGIAYYTTHTEEYSRYDHSLGVFHLLRANGRPLKEQIAGLLHDVSHTVFSHVGDWVFKREHSDTDYQNSIHEEFLLTTDIGPILKRYGFTAKELLPKGDLFSALEKSRPDLCADRLEYNLQGAYHRGFITKAEALELFHDCRYLNDQWLTKRTDLMEKVVSFALFMTEDCFGGVTNHLSSSWLAEAIRKGIEIKLITSDEFHHGTDNAIWDKLSSSKEPYIQSRLNKIFETKNLYTLAQPGEKADFILKTKFWGFDPLVLYKGKKVRLTTISPTLLREYQAVKERINAGFSVKWRTEENALANSS